MIPLSPADPAAADRSASVFVPPPLPKTGYRELDDAHETLSRRMAELGGLIGNGPIADAVTVSVTLLFELREDYAIEEALMFRTGYPDFTRHQASHAVLEQTFSVLSRSLRAAAANAPGAESRADMLALLGTGSRMLAAHVVGADVALTKYVLARDTGRAARA